MARLICVLLFVAVGFRSIKLWFTAQRVNIFFTQDTFDGCPLLSEVSLRFFRSRSDGVQGADTLQAYCITQYRACYISSAPLCVVSRTVPSAHQSASNRFFSFFGHIQHIPCIGIRVKGSVCKCFLNLYPPRFLWILNKRGADIN